MYRLEDLFDLRGVVGSRLENLIADRGLTKSAVCSGAGMSRPTLDKMLAGEVNNKANFEKHISKLLSYFEMSANELMGSIENPFNDMRHLRNAISMNIQELSARSGISVEELKRIEAGDDAPLSVLRDLALCLGTGVMGLLGENYFQTTISSLTYAVDDGSDGDTIRSPGGVWGHLGVLLKGQPRYLWFPITAYTRSLVYENRKLPYMAVPCMDNSLLLINNENIKELILLDEACSEPEDMDWDYEGSFGEIPAVIYEAFDDYVEYKMAGGDPAQYDLSENMISALDQFVAENKIDSEEFENELEMLTVMSEDGSVRKHGFWEDIGGEVAYAVMNIYEMGKPMDEPYMAFRDTGEAEIIVNLKQISMVKLPRTKIEKEIRDIHKEILEDERDRE